MTLPDWATVVEFAAYGTILFWLAKKKHF
jgi:hypothetical protein